MDHLHAALSTVFDQLLQVSACDSLAIAAEIECYITGIEPTVIDQALEVFSSSPTWDSLSLDRWEPEDGKQQYEFQFQIHTCPIALADHICGLRDALTEQLQEAGGTVSFTAKPFEDQPGNGMHIHVSLWQEKQNLFAKQDGKESIPLMYAIGGLCTLLKESVYWFCPLEEDYERFRNEAHTPTTISWGGNNRTTAIRIPSTEAKERRIEHRIPSASSDPYAVCLATLEGIRYGIENKIEPPEKIWGNASDSQYNLPTLPQTLDEAKNAYENGTQLHHLIP